MIFQSSLVWGFMLLFSAAVVIRQTDSQNFGDDIDSVGFGGDVVSKNEDHRFKGRYHYVIKYILMMFKYNYRKC